MNADYVDHGMSPKAKAVAWAALAVVVVAIIAVLSPIRSNPAHDLALQRLIAVREKCDQLISDSALGAERRTTRQLCEGTIAAAEAELRRTPRRLP